MNAATRLDFSLRKITDEPVKAVPGGHELTSTAYVARVDGERLHHFVAVATATEFYAGWEVADYQAAALRLHRKLRNRLAELADDQVRERD